MASKPSPAPADITATIAQSAKLGQHKKKQAVPLVRPPVAFNLNGSSGSEINGSYILGSVSAKNSSEFKSHNNYVAPTTNDPIEQARKEQQEHVPTSITQGPGSAISFGQQGGITAGTINISSPPTSYNYDGSLQRTVRGGENRLESRDPNPIMKKIQTEIASGNSKQALSDAQTLSDSEPLWATPHVLAGIAYANLGSPVSARRELEKAKALVPVGSEYEDDYIPHFQNLENGIKRQETKPQ